MDTREFERLLKKYIRAANGGNTDDEVDAAWAVITEAANQLGVPIPLASEV